MKANSVPMLVRSTTSAMLAKAAKVATKSPVRMVPTYGVLNSRVNLGRNGGRSPSRAIDMKIRG